MCCCHMTASELEELSRLGALVAAGRLDPAWAPRFAQLYFSANVFGPHLDRRNSLEVLERFKAFLAESADIVQAARAAVLN